jgi:endonuclease/exonuclease/phosphatase family metal-dependent hydrolase
MCFRGRKLPRAGRIVPNAPARCRAWFGLAHAGGAPRGALGTKRAIFDLLQIIAVAFLVLATAPRSAAEMLTVATYNVENYVLANRLVDGAYREAYPKTEASKQALRTVIRALNADILALQEMGPAPYLEELRRDLATEGLDYPHAALLDAADPDRHVAVLSKRAFTSIGRHADLAFTYFGKEERVKRGLLEVRVHTEAGEIALFVVHLKSRFTDRTDDPMSAVRRAGEATAVRDRVLSIFADPASARFAILGDCNDSPASKTLKFLCQRGKTRIAEIVPAVDARGETWTHFYRKEDVYSRVDFALVSPALKAAVVGGAAQIFDGEATRLASDHRPVLLKLELNSATHETAH